MNESVETAIEISNFADTPRNGGQSEYNYLLSFLCSATSLPLNTLTPTIESLLADCAWSDELFVRVVVGHEIDSVH